MKPSSMPQGTSPAAWDSKDRREKIRIITKLFSMYPLAGNQAPELTMSSYLEELQDVPALILSHALHRLTRKTKTFLPSVGEIRAEAGRVVAMANRAAKGQDPSGYNPREEPGQIEDCELWLTRDRILQALPAGVREQVAMIPAKVRS